MILDRPEINKVLKERLVGGWRSRLLSILRKSTNKDVVGIMKQAEGVGFLDEEGRFQSVLINFVACPYSNS